MKHKYDIIVIGAGSGGLGVALGMAQFGFDVLLVDKNRENFGGECLNSGCVPSKALIHVAGIIKKSREAEDYGLRSEGEVDLQKVWGYVREKQEIIRAHETPKYLREEEGVDVLVGEAAFVDRKTLQVNGQRIKAKKILVATGSKPRTLDFKGSENVKVLTNENLFELDFLPKNLLILGGGPIAMEMCQCFARLGSKVTVVEKHERIMRKELPEVSELVQKRLEQEGIDFKFQRKLKEMGADGNMLLEDADGHTEKLPCDAILMAIGREISYDSLKLEKAGVKIENGKPLIDDYLRAKGNRRILFAGDAAGNMLFSHAAELHTSILLNNFFVPGPFRKKLGFDHFSWCTFTDPEVCTFGLSEEEIKTRGIKYDRIDHSFESDDRATVSDYRYGRLILFLKKNKINPRNGKILGGTVVAPNAGEMAQELILANHEGLGAGSVFNKTYPYPVQTRVHKMALVEEFSKGVSPAIKRMLKLLYH